MWKIINIEFKILIHFFFQNERYIYSMYLPIPLTFSHLSDNKGNQIVFIESADEANISFLHKNKLRKANSNGVDDLKDQNRVNTAGNISQYCIQNLID